MPVPVQLTGKKGLHLCAAVFNQRYMVHIFANTDSCSREMKVSKPRDPMNVPPGLSCPVCQHVVQIQQKFPTSALSVRVCFCAWSRSPQLWVAPAWQSLAGPPQQTGRWPWSLGWFSCGSGLDAVLEINHISLKSCNGPLFLLENTPGSSLESWGDRPRLLCSALHKIASSRWTSLMSKLLASDGK